MNKFITFLISLILLTSLAFGQNYEVLWENSVAQGSLPGWFTTTSTERGFGFGTVSENDRLYIVSRNGGTNVLIYNAVSGDSVGKLDVTGVSGGTFALNDADVSGDGIIFACNLTTDASASNFKVYRWDGESATPSLVIDYNDATGGRFGDKFSVVGSASDNSLVIYAAKAASTTIVKFTTADNGASFSANAITVANASGNTPAVGPKGTGDANFYVNGAGTSAYEYDASGTLVSQIPGSILGTGSNAIRYHDATRNLYAVSFQYGAAKENARVMDVTFGNANASSYLETPSLGANANGNGTGDVALNDNGDGTFNVYVLSSNNGFGAYKVHMAPDLFLSEYVEGTSNNKALELYNPTGAALDLSHYRLLRSNNGATVYQDSLEFAAGTLLEAEAVYVVANPQAVPEILDLADTTHTITFYNGDDHMAIAKMIEGEWVVIDVIGVLGEDPGSAWDVAGVAAATNEQTLVRKSDVTYGATDWAASAGTNADDSQWIVYDQNTFIYLGVHPGERFVQGPVSVTFNVNSSTVEGFTDSTEVIQIRGGIQEVGGPSNNWDNTVLKWGNDSPEAANVGGDYWQATIVFPDSIVGKEVNWKIGASRTDADGIPLPDFWENNDNRIFVLPAVDTVLGMSYVSSGTTPPYTPSDSFDVYFRVNMSTNTDFDPTSDILSVVGGFPAMDGGANMWSPGTWRLTRESETSDYWGFHLKLAQTSDNYPGDIGGTLTKDSVLYRFAIGTDWDNSENLGGKYISNPAGAENRVTQVYNDTTLAWKYWNDVVPGTPAGEDTVQVKFRVDMTNAIADKGFIPGDTLEVHFGYNASSNREDIKMINEFGSDFYAVTVDVKNFMLGEKLVYQYYVIPTGSNVAVRENFYDFDDPNPDTQEKRKILIPTPKPAEPFVILDDVDSKFSPRRMPIFPNASKLQNEVTVTWSVDLRPAYYQVKFGGDTLKDINNVVNVSPAELDSIFNWGVWINGPAAGGWDNPDGSFWGTSLEADTTKKMYDDGSNGDVTSGDSTYSRQYRYSPDSTNNTVGQVYKFGIKGGDNEPGQGGFGLNHTANIDDSQPNYTIHTQFGSINPPFYTHWDFDNNMPTNLDELGDGIVIRDPNLEANYPNPFNPTTTLTFELPKQMEVQLVVYDVLGRKVIELVSGVQRPGVHQVIWNGADNHGRPVSSGVYFYRMVTENYERTMKMVLMR